MRYAAVVYNRHLDVELNQTENLVEARMGDRTYSLDAREVEPGIYSFISGNRSFETTVAESANGYIVSIGTRRIPVEIIDYRAALQRGAHDGWSGAVEVRAPMPGKIVKILVQEGEAVQANQGIVVMEAMKMQNEIRSPKQGLVRKLRVNEGDAVNAGDLLAAVE